MSFLFDIQVLSADLMQFLVDLSSCKEKFWRGNIALWASQTRQRVSSFGSRSETGCQTTPKWRCQRLDSRPRCVLRPSLS